MYDRVRPVDDPAFYLKWALEHRRCMACGVPYYHAAKQNHGVGLTRHHVVKFRRSDEPCNLLTLCGRDHDLAEGRQVRVPGGDGSEIYPALTLGVCLTLKTVRDPENWDPGRLAELFGRALPGREPIPEFLQREWLRWSKSPV
jgi:hypothetical protein